MEELLKIAKENYPAGTVFKSAFDPQNTQIVEGNWEKVSNGIIVSPGATYIYFKEKWAEIISKPEVKEKTMTLLEQAKKRFPVGTKFVPAHIDTDESDRYCIIVEYGEFVEDEDNEITQTLNGSYWDENYNPEYGNTKWNRVVYFRGNWARIIEEPKVDEKQIIEKIEERNEICTKKDPINPSHYTSSKIECIDAIESALSPEEFKGFLRGNIIKYNWRCMQKNGAEDLKKSQWYLDRLIKTLEDVESKSN